MQNFWIYPIYTTALGIILISVVPRSKIKELGLFGILSGGVGDFIILLIFKFIIHKRLYINYYPFGISGLAFFPPIAWSIWFIVFYYFLPENKILKYIYIAVAAAYSTFFANVLVNLKIMHWEYERTFIPFLIYLVWFVSFNWLKEKIESNMEG